MKQFLIKIGYVFISAIVILVVLDILYTSAYTNSRYTRSKVAWFFSLPKEKSFDYAVFGSSRAYFNLDTKLIESRTGVKGLNLAFPSSKSFEIKLMVKLFLEKYHVDKIFIQMDNQYEIINNDKAAIVPFLPYIDKPIVSEAFSETVEDYYYLKNIPFYRYMKYDSKLGFREFMMGFYKKDSPTNNLGNSEASKKIMEPTKTKFKFHLADRKNKHLEDVIKICKEKNIQVYFYTAPIYKAEGNLDVLEKNLPNYHDFSDNFEDAKFFIDSYHLNDVGTSVFTTQFINAYFKP